MGKDWLYHWGSGGSGSSSGGRRRNRGVNNNTFSCSSGGDSGSVVSNSTSSTSTPSGCINAVIQLFDFHPFHFSSNFHNQPHDHTTFLPHESTTDVPVKGAEAPRNSLDIHDGTNFMEAATLSYSNLKKDETLHFQKDIKIKTSGHTRSLLGRDDDNSTISSNSPGGTKTPTLVARLMGLDLLPDTSSPRVSSSSSTINNHSRQLQNLALNKKKPPASSANAFDFNSHSLPVTPRTSSSSSARRSDIDQRYSLQNNKENNDVGSCQEIEFSKFLKSKISAARMHEDEDMSPGHYAKQLVKQFKESVSRRVGKDITNTTVTNHDYQRRDQNVVLLKPKKPSNLGNGSESCTSKSPRLRLSAETKSKPVATKNYQDIQHYPKLLSSQLCSDKQSKSCEAVPLRSKPQKATSSPRETNQKQKSSLVKSKLVIHSDENMKCSSKFKKPPQTLDLMRNKQEEPFVRPALTNGRASQITDSKCKRTPLPTLLSLKKKEMKRQKQFYDSEASDPSLSKKNTQMLSCNLSQSYKQDLMNDQNSLMGAEQLTDYISIILNCTGIFNHTPITIFTFNSPSHPLDPSVFHKLPKLHNGKLVFELVDQLLAGILQPRLGYNRSFYPSKKFMFGQQLKCYSQCTKFEHQDDVMGNVPMYGEQLLDILCNKIRNFGWVKCLVLEDIDALIDKDLPPKLLECEEEVEGIVMEIEGYILERLVHETVTLG